MYSAIAMCADCGSSSSAYSQYPSTDGPASYSRTVLKARHDPAPRDECRRAPNRLCIIDIALAAAELIEDATARDVSLLNVSAAQAQAGQLDEAVATINRVRSSYGHLSPLLLIAEQQAARGDYQAVVSTIAEINDRHSQIVALSLVAKQFRQREDFEKADRAADVMIGIAAFERDRYAYIENYLHAATLLAQAGDTDRARIAVKAVLAMLEKLESADLDNVLAGIVKAQCSIGDVDGAVAMTARIVGHSPKVGAHLCIAQLQFKSLKAESARTSIGLAHASAANIGERRSRDIALADVAVARVAMENADAALKTAGEVNDTDIRFSAVLRIGRTLSEIADRESAAKVFDLAFDDASKIADSWRRELAFLQLAEAQSEIGAVAAAMHIGDRIEADAMRASVWKVIALGFARTGDLESATTAVQRLDSQIDRAAALVAVSEEALESGDLAAADAAVGMALTEIGENWWSPPTDAVSDMACLVSEVVKIQVKMRAMAGADAQIKALKIASATSDEAARCTVSALTSLIRERRREGDIRTALATAESIGALRQRVSSLLELAGAWSE